MHNLKLISFYVKFSPSLRGGKGRERRWQATQDDCEILYFGIGIVYCAELIGQIEILWPSKIYGGSFDI